MKWAVIILSVLTALLAIWSFSASNDARGPDASMDAAFLVILAFVFGSIDFVLIIIWLAIT